MDAANAASILVSTLTALVTGLDLHFPLRPYLVLVALCVIPGVAAWARHPLDDPALWLTVVFGTSITLVSVIGLALVWSGHWEPRLAAAGVSTICALALGSALPSAHRREQQPMEHCTTAKGEKT